jgi:hypothetical protein
MGRLFGTVILLFCVMLTTFAPKDGLAQSAAADCASSSMTGPMVPDKKTAVAIVEAMSPGQGIADWLPKLRPFEARLDKGIWWITSQLDRSINPPKGILVQINRCNGQVKMFTTYPVD